MESGEVLKLAQRARSQVQYAVKTGKLVSLKKVYVKCIDCGARATDYDHRDYLKPLDVDPVCRKCNRRRGNAIQGKTGILADNNISSAGYRWSGIQNDSTEQGLTEYKCHINIDDIYEYGTDDYIWDADVSIAREEWASHRLARLMVQRRMPTCGAFLEMTSMK